MQSLGIQLDVRHFAATPVGMRVRAEAEVIAVEGRAIRFRLSAADEVEAISEGTHERVVVTVARFDRRMLEKAARTRPA
jgi:predicted thioesterase